MEFDDIHASPNLIFRYLTNSGNLSEWFADSVNSTDNEHFEFTWDGTTEYATLVDAGADEFVKYVWDYDKDTPYYLEFRLVIDELTGDRSLMITDFAEKSDLEDTKLLWESQINDLKHILGC